LGNEEREIAKESTIAVSITYVIAFSFLKLKKYKNITI
jgi:hypothetical protein